MSHLIVCVCIFLLLFATLPTASAHSFLVITPTSHALLSTHQVKRFISIKWWENETTREQNNTPTKKSNFHFYNTCINGWLSNMLHVHSISSPFRHRSVTFSYVRFLYTELLYSFCCPKSSMYTHTHKKTRGDLWMLLCQKNDHSSMKSISHFWWSLMQLRTHIKLRRWSALVTHTDLIYYGRFHLYCGTAADFSTQISTLATSPSHHFCICVRKGIFHSNFVHYVEYFIRGRAC